MSVDRSSQRSGGSAAQGPMGRGPMGAGWGAMGRPTEKAKDFKGTVKRFLGYFMPQKYRLLTILIATIISTTFTIVGPKILGMATTRLFENLRDGIMALQKHAPAPGIDLTYIGMILLILLGLYMLSSIFSYIQQYLMASVAQTTVYQLRKEVDEKLSRLPLKYFDTRTHGEILSRAVNDMDNISTTLQQSLTQLATSTITVIGVLIMMLTISWELSLITLITLPLSMFVTVVVAKRSQEYFRRQQRALGELNGHVEEMYTGHKIVKAFGHEKKAIAEFQRTQREPL